MAHPRKRVLFPITVSACLALSAITMSVGAVRADHPDSQLVTVVETDPPVINPAMTTSVSSFSVGSMIYSALTIANQDFSYSGDLAESWEVSDDGLTYTFHLREGVLWHDGVPFTSADVKFSLEEINSKYQPYGIQVYSRLDRVDTPDELTAVVHLSEPFAPFLAGSNITASTILPKHIWENGDPTENEANQAPIGTGPYKFVEWVSGDHITLERNDDYYIEGQPHFEGITIRVMPDAASRVAAFENHEIDVMYHNALPHREAERLGSLEGAELKPTDNRGAASMMFFNVREEPLSDKQVRKALAHAIDRQFIRDNVTAPWNFETPMLGPLPSVSNMYNPNLEDYELDPELAGQMLDEAGYPADGGSRFTLGLYYESGDTEFESMAQIIQQNLAAIDVTVELNALEEAALIDTAMVGLQFDLLLGSYGLGPDPAIGVERLYHSSRIFDPPRAATNMSGYSNPEVDALFDEEKTKTDEEERKAVYAELQEIVWDDVPILPLASSYRPNVFWTDAVTGLFEGPFGYIESYATAVPGGEGAVAASPSATSEASPGAAPSSDEGSTPGWLVPGLIAAAVIIVGGVLLFRRRSAA